MEGLRRAQMDLGLDEASIPEGSDLHVEAPTATVEHVNEKANLKKAIKASYKTGKHHRAEWSDSYEKGFSRHHNEAAIRIQKGYRRFRVIRAAVARKQQLIQRKATGKDKLAKLVLMVFNLSLGLASLIAAIVMWYHVLNCEGGVLDAFGLYGAQGTMCMPTMSNKVMCWVQLGFVGVSWIGLHGLDESRTEWLRAYSFLMLLIVAAQISVVGMFALDESTAMQGMQNETYATVLTQACEVAPVLTQSTAAVNYVEGTAGLLNETGQGTARNSTQNATSYYDELCRCAEGTEPQVCVEEFIADQLQYIVYFCVGLITVELFVARLAWKYLALPVDHSDPAGEVKQLNLWLEEHDLERYARRIIILGVRSKNQVLEVDLSTAREMGMSQEDLRKFFIAQSTTKVKDMQAPDALGLIGWEKIIVSHLALDAELTQHVSILIKTWYFESSVLCSVLLTMYVLANQSAAYPPTDAEAAFLQSCQTFVTIFYTLEIMLELVCEVSAKRSAKYFKDPWHLVDLLVLIIYWLYLIYPMFYNILLEIPGMSKERAELAGITKHQPSWISALRVGRVLRPLRTLRMLGDVTIIAECIGHSVHLFRDIILLSAFVILLFSIIGISSFAGSLHYTCITCADGVHAWNVETIPAEMADRAMQDFTNTGLSKSEYLGGCLVENQLVYENRAWVLAADAESAEYPDSDSWGHYYHGTHPCPMSLRCHSQREVARETGADLEPDYTHWGWDKPIMCVAKLKTHPDANKTDVKRPVWQGVGEDEYGTRSFDNVFLAFYTMFILMTGDNGMQDIPNAMWEADTTSQWLAWPMFATAAVMLTLILLNLFLAICCSVFEEIHCALEQARAGRARRKEVDERLQLSEQLAAEQAKIQKQEEDRAQKSAESQRKSKIASVASGTTGLVATAAHLPADMLNETSSFVDQTINTAYKTTTATVDRFREKVLDNPGIGLSNMEEDREKMHTLYDETEKKGGWRLYVVYCVDSRFFEILLMIAICAYALVVMGQDLALFTDRSDIETFKGQLMKVELGLLIVFVVEFGLKILGLGLHVLHFGENRLDLLILLCTILGYVGTYNAQQLAERQAQVAAVSGAGFELVASVSLGEQVIGDSSWEDGNSTSLSSVFSAGHWSAGIFDKVVKVSRITQLFRMTYKYRTMREVLKKVFQTASTTVVLVIFVIFFLCMCTLIMMHVMGGGCDMEWNRARLETLWDSPGDCEYPEANFETFSIGFLTSFQIMTGEDWSEVMFWYYRYSPIGAFSAPFFMIMWVLVHGVLYSLFVAVLLLNFSMEEHAKMPEQQRQYKARKKQRQKKGKGVGHGLTAVMEREMVEQSEGVGDAADDPVLGLLAAADRARTLGESKLQKNKSLLFLDLSHPLRIFCCRIESHKHFETMVLVAILASCLAMTQARRCVYTDAGDSSMANGGGNGCAGGIDPVAIVEDCVLGVFYLELVLRSVSRGFFFKSGPRAPYLRSGMNQIDFAIIAVCTSTRILMPTLDGNSQNYAKMLQSMAPMASLVRHRGLRKIFGAFRSALPMISVVSVPIIFLMAILGFIGVEVFGNGQMRQCMPLPESLVKIQKGDDVEKDPQGLMLCHAIGGAVTGACEHSQTSGIAYLDEDERYAGLNETECLGAQLNGAAVEWKQPPFGFDDAFQGILSLLKAATAGVMPIQNVGLHVAGPGLAPDYLASHFSSIAYFVVFHLIFTFFLLNLFIGVMSTSFSKSTGTLVVTSLQRRWIQCNNMVEKFAPHDDEHEEDKPVPTDHLFLLRLKFFNLVSDRRFRSTQITVIILNCTILLVSHYPAADPRMPTAILYVDHAFLLFYTMEMILKLIGFGFSGYFSKAWNCFDCSLVAISIITALNDQTSGIESLRVLRALRLFLLAKQLPGLMSMIDTVLKCIVPALTIAGIMSVFLFLYAVAGIQLFGDAGWDHDFYNENNNFATFPNAVMLLFQVMFGQNYMWLTADLAAEGKSEVVATAYFLSFFIIMVLINLNLFAVIVLDNFAAENAVAQTIGPQDLWIFTHAWAEQTMGAGSCMVFQRGVGAATMKSAELLAKGNDDILVDDHEPEDAANDEYDGITSPRAPSDNVGLVAMKKLKKRGKKRPYGVAVVKIEKITGLPLGSDGAFEGMRPYVRLFTRPHGRSQPVNTKVQTKTTGTGILTTTSFKEEFKVPIDQRENSLGFEVVDQISDRKLARAFYSTKRVAKHLKVISADLITLDLLGDQRPISEATPEDWQRINSSRAGTASPTSPGNKSPSGKRNRSKSGSKSPKSSTSEPMTFRPKIGEVHFTIVFQPKLRMPRFDFMGEYNENSKIKEGGGSGIEGWLWKRGGDAMFPKWERRWMWLSIPSVHEPDTEPAVNYYKECDDEAELDDRGRSGTLVIHSIPAHEISEVHAHLRWEDGKDHKVAGKDAPVLAESEFQFTRAARTSVNGKQREASVYRFRALSPLQKSTWVSSLKWLQSAGHPEDHGDGRSKEELVAAIVARAETTRDERDMYHEALSREIAMHSMEELRHRDWLEVMKHSRPDRLPIPPLNERDVERVTNNPALIDMPFSRARFLLIELHRYGVLGCNHLTREWLLYTLYNLEMYGMTHNTHKGPQLRAMHAHTGCYIAEIRGLNYMQTLRRLSLLHYGKRHSLMFQQQVEEYEHDLYKVAVNLISTAVSAWIFGKMLPKYHEKLYGTRKLTVLYGKGKEVHAAAKKAMKDAAKSLYQENEERAARGEPARQPDKFDRNAHRHETYPANSVWRRLPKAHSVAVVGIAALRIESLAHLFRAIQKEKPTLLVEQDKAREAERQRVDALSPEEREQEEAQKKQTASAEATRRAQRKEAGCGCFRKKDSDVASQIFKNPMNATDEQSSPFNSSLLGDEPTSIDLEQDTGISIGMTIGKRSEDIGRAHSLDLQHDDGDNDISLVSEETLAAYRKVYNGFTRTPGAPLDQDATARLIDEHYALVLVDLKLSAKQYVRRYWADPKRPQMCSDPAAGFSFEDYILWEGDNYTLGFGDRQRTEHIKTSEEVWAEAHQASNQDQLAVLKDAADASLSGSSDSTAASASLGARSATTMANPILYSTDAAADASRSTVMVNPMNILTR